MAHFDSLGVENENVAYKIAVYISVLITRGKTR